MKKDNIFALKQEPIPAFKFNEEVASVFDDMIKRSVPFYMESLKRQCYLTSHFYQVNTKIYDLGCSHGNLGIMIYEAFKDKPYAMIAVDSSPFMIEKYCTRLEKIENLKRINTNFEKMGTNLESINTNLESINTNFEMDINFQAINNRLVNISIVCGVAEEITISDASVVIVNLTMQFIKPEKRDNFIKGIYNGLNAGGILLLTEKIIHENSKIAEIDHDVYKKFKIENGYSELEINRKRDALDNILIPETIQSHSKRLQNAGFSIMDIWFKWFNFASMIAIK